MTTRGRQRAAVAVYLSVVDAAAKPAAEETPADSHTVRTNEAGDENGRAEGSAVTH